LVSDVPLYRDGVARTLAGAREIAVVGSAASADEATVLVRRLTPDVVLMDMAMPHAFDVARDIAQHCPQTRVVALAIPEVDHEVVACAEVGVVGYVARNGSVSDAIDVISSAARGEALCSPRIVASLLRRIAALAAERQHGGAPVNGAQKPALAGLTTRETEILALLKRGLSNKMIARRLGIELATVKNHVHSVFGKLGLRRRAEAAVLERTDNLESTTRTDADDRDPEPVH
jgi:DNA-binding NarL/FixJ family response regulator